MMLSRTISFFYSKLRAYSTEMSEYDFDDVMTSYEFTIYYYDYAMKCILYSVNVYPWQVDNLKMQITM